MALTVIDWFSGIGGFRLGLEPLGFKFIAHSEVDPYAEAVYRKHWPGCPNLGDALDCWDSLSAVLERSSREEHRPGPLAPPVPSLVLLENVQGWRYSGLRQALADLAAVGFDAEWFTLCSCLFGAPHHRERVFLLAYPNCDGEPIESIHEEVARLPFMAGQLSWPDPPGRLGMADGVPDRVDRNRCLGNSVVPQVVNWIGRRILEGMERLEPSEPRR